MGWTGMHREPGTTDFDFFTKELALDGGTRDNGSTRHKLIDGMTYRNVFYGVVVDGGLTEAAGTRWALVVLLLRNRSDGASGAGWFNFHYKEMTEHMGPAEDRCPKRILDQLDPTTSEWANQWRERCRESLARRERARIKPGQVVRFGRTLSFGDGVEDDTLVFVKLSTFRRSSDGHRVRVPGWRDNYAFEILAS